MNFTKIRMAINVAIVTSIIGLAISYFTQLIDVIPDLTFLESVGIYALYMPIHHSLITSNYIDNE